MLKSKFIYKAALSVCLLILLCCGQVSLTAHLHHSHSGSTLVDAANTSVHGREHPDQLPLGPIEHEHQFKKRIEWNYSRLHQVVKLVVDAPLFVSTDTVSPVITFGEASYALHPSIPVKPLYITCATIRGPPQTV